MEKRIIITRDGSTSIAIPALNVTYRSIHGAISESRHVFIWSGLHALSWNWPLRIFEMGFGSGLNALMTLLEADRARKQVFYTAIDQLQLAAGEVAQLNYCQKLDQVAYDPLFRKMHDCEWNQEERISPFFLLKKVRADLLHYSAGQLFDLIYYDAFAPSAQPDLWTQPVFERLFRFLANGGILVTYCSKGEVRRAMQAAGFEIEKLPGPPGKREMLRARKPASSP